MDLSKLSDAELDALEAKAKGAAPAAAPPSEPDSFFRQLGLTTRAGVRGVTALPGALSDASIRPMLNLAISPFTDKRFPSSGRAAEEFSSGIGLPEPKNATERVAQDVASSMASLGGTAKAGQVLTEAMSPMAKALGEFLSSRLGTQATATAAGAAGGGVARESGASPSVQMMASIASALVPQGLKSAAEMGGGLVHKVLEPHLEGGADAVKARTLAELVGDRKPAVLDALQNAPRTIVPGSNPTAAEVASSAGSTELSALEKLLGRKYDPSGYADRTNSQIAAREAFAPEPGVSSNLIYDTKVPVDAARSELNAKMADIGSVAAQNKVKALFETVEPPGLLHRPTMIARALLERVQGHANEKLLRELTQDMKDPDTIARLLAAARVKEQQSGMTHALTAAELQMLANGGH